MTNSGTDHNLVPQRVRQNKLNTILKSNGFDSLILNAGPSLTYLTGLHFHLSERPVLVIFIPGEIPKIILPQLELEKIKALPFEIESFPYGEDPESLSTTFRKAIHEAKLIDRKNGVEPRQLRLLEYDLLTEAAPGAKFLPATECVSALRMYKDEVELSFMRKAARIAEQALISTLPYVKIGVSERELAAELTLQLLRAGSEPEVPFSPIISSGPNSANPHASPSERKLAAGDLLVIDWGATFNGYCSDITRTFMIGEVAPEFISISQIVLEANTAGRIAARPQVPAHDVDRAARSVTESSGYGKYFTHRTGHGLGMEGHEEPYIRAENPLILTPGMVFTIEPGIYLPDQNGVRIEDDMVITDEGSETLTSLPRDVYRL